MWPRPFECIKKWFWQMWTREKKHQWVGFWVKSTDSDQSLVANVKLISNEIHPKVNIWSYAELISRKENFFEMPSFNKTPDWVTYYLFFRYRPIFQEVLNDESKGKLQHMIIVLFHVINCRWGCIKDSRIPESQKIKDSWISGYHGFHELQDFMKQSIPWHQGFYGKRIPWLVWSRM